MQSHVKNFTDVNMYVNWTPRRTGKGNAFECPPVQLTR